MPSLQAKSVNGMVRPCSASERSWPGAPRTMSTPCLRIQSPQSLQSASISARTHSTLWALISAARGPSTGSFDAADPVHGLPCFLGAKSLASGEVAWRWPRRYSVAVARVYRHSPEPDVHGVKGGDAPPPGAATEPSNSTYGRQNLRSRWHSIQPRKWHDYPPRAQRFGDNIFNLWPSSLRI